MILEKRKESRSLSLIFSAKKIVSYGKEQKFLVLTTTKVGEFCMITADHLLKADRL